MNIPFTDLTQRPPRSTRTRLGGYVLLPRMLDKGRAEIAGKSGEFHYNCPLDQRLLAFLGLDAEALRAELATGKGDGEILEWIKAHQRNKHTSAEIEAWSDEQSKRGPDADTQEFFHEMLQAAGPHRTDIKTWADMLDLDDYVTYGGKAWIFMKAWVIQSHGSVDGLALVDQTTPDLAAGEVLVRVRAVSLNYRDLIALEAQRAGNLPPPLVPCSDGAGEVIAVGTGVTRWKIGDRVAGLFFRDWTDGPFDLKYHNAAGGGSIHGWLRECVAYPEHGLVAIADGFSFEEAATLPCAGVTAWQALFTRGGLRDGAAVLVLGTGGVSVFALQLATAAGARVIVTSSNDEKLARARKLGAAETVNYTTTPDWDKEVWRLTAKRGVDHVVEVGGPGTLGKSMNSIGAGGQIALIGVLTGFGAPDVSLFPIVARNVRLDGIYVGSRADFEALNAFLITHRIRPIIDRTFAFEDAHAAFAHMQSAAHFGKIVIAIP